MSRTALALACLALGLVGGFLGALLAPGPGAAPAAAPAPGRPERDPAAGDIARRLAAVEERLAAAASGVPAATDAPVPAAAGEGAALPAEESGDGAPSLLSRVERLERAAGLLPEDLSKATTEELKAHFEKNSQNGRNNGPLVGVLEELLRRGLPEEEARKLRFQLGYGYRGLGQHDREEALFREMVRILPTDSPDGQFALFQLAWSRSYQKDAREGSRLMEQLADNETASDPLRSNGLFQAGMMAHGAGDLDRARVLLERLVGPESKRVAASQRGMIDQAKRTLAEMEGK